MKTNLKLYPKFPSKKPTRWVAYGGQAHCVKLQEVYMGRIIKDDPNRLKKLIGKNSENFGWILDVQISDKWVIFIGVLKTVKFRNTEYSASIVELLIPENESGKWWKDE